MYEMLTCDCLIRFTDSIVEKYVAWHTNLKCEDGCYQAGLGQAWHNIPEEIPTVATSNRMAYGIYLLKNVVHCERSISHIGQSVERLRAYVYKSLNHEIRKDTRSHHTNQ